jgi:hypothetical protein
MLSSCDGDNTAPGNSNSNNIIGTPDGYWAPWVTKTTTTSAVINWQGQGTGNSIISYATTEYYKQTQSFDHVMTYAATAPFQHIQLTGLAPNTSYTYSVTCPGGMWTFGARSFRTMPLSGPFTFIVISDSQEGHNYDETMRFKYVAEAIAKEPDALFILHGGDNAGFDDPSKWTIFFQVADVMLSKFAIFPVIGNHEYHHLNESSGPPTNAVNFHSSYDTPLNYSFDCAGVRFVILNSPDPTVANADDPQTSLALANSQAPWLEGVLDNALAGTFTMHHHPIWDDGRTDINNNLAPWEALYHTYKISANFAGHTHNYQRYLIRDIPYFVVGNAGGRFADITVTHADGFQLAETRQLGYLRVTVDPANNSARAEEIFVASVKKDDSNETPVVYSKPLVGDSVTFPLK